MATRLVEGKKPYTGGKAIEIDENKVISLRLRDENNLIIWDEGDNEIYVDLQLPADIEPTDAFPVGITTGRVSTVDGWDKTGTIICAKTTNGDNIKLLYADDGTLYIDNGTGIFKQIYLKGDIDAIVQAIYQYIDANFNTKTFFINNNEEEMSVIQDAYTWVANGGEAILCYRYGGLGRLYISETINNTGMLTFKGTINCDKYIRDYGYTKLMFSNLQVYATNGVVTGITWSRNNLLNAIEANTTYDTPYIPQFPSQPTSKKYVDDKVAELMALGKFLSLWSCKDGEPMSFPLTTPYAYTTGDYYLVGELATGSNPNLKPDGSSYDTGDVSQVIESAEVQIGDVYIYDGAVWMHQLNHERTTTFANIAGQPTDNQNLATALGNKQDTLVNQSNIKSVNNNSLLGSGNLVLDTVPSGGTQGQVLTKQSVGYGWANATGGAEIEYKTQAEYNALLPGALTDNKHYFIYSTSGGGGYLIDITNIDKSTTYTVSWSTGLGGIYSLDGTKFLGSNRSSGVVCATLTTPFDLSTVSSTATENPGGDIHQIFWSWDGTRAAFASWSGYIGMRELTTPRDFSSKTNYQTKSFTSVVGVSFNPTGNILYVSRWENNDSIVQYSLSTARDLSSTATQTGILQTGYQTRGVSFSSDGMYLLNTNTDGNIYQYKLSTPRDITTATLYKTHSYGCNIVNMLLDDSGFVINGSTSQLILNKFYQN